MSYADDSIVQWLRRRHGGGLERRAPNPGTAGEVEVLPAVVAEALSGQGLDVIE
jgi:hypothetical protein